MIEKTLLEQQSDLRKKLGLHPETGVPLDPVDPPKSTEGDPGDHVSPPKEEEPKTLAGIVPTHVKSHNKHGK